ncbi:MAG: protease complex subunit PrcB family protein [Candidatus Eisenbacteria bacterium]|nr:protease complex subunit PrcB family protein [Candidatus Eisenbacteria bacterium]
MMRSVSMTILAVCALTWVGCASQTTAPEDESSSWNWVRLHEGDTDSYSDLSIGANGEFALDSSSRGGESPARGLLAGERLETLARLIGDLPLETYSAQGSCEDEYVLSVTRDGSLRTYRGSDCAEGTPASLTSLRDFLAGFAAEIDEPQRLDAGAVRVLASGSTSAIRTAREVVLDDRDELFALIREHRPGGIVALPPVDFRNEVVVAIFAGEKQSDGYSLSHGATLSGDNGWLTVQIISTEPGRGCEPASTKTQPFLLLAVARTEGGMVLDHISEVEDCGF